VGNLVDFGFTTEELEFILEKIGAEGFFTVLGWLDNVLTTERFVSEIGEASKRINDIVNAVKSYSHLDRASERQKSDIHEGIRKTLMIMAYKIKKNGITILENFDPTMPEPKVFVGELNQVWTNLIDNAVDALENSAVKTLEIATSHKTGFVEIRLIDSGAGIPLDIQSNIFEPFFTTKAMGKGTGLGLNAVQRIIQQHNGDIKVVSEPGRTEFRVCLPLE
ncbi:MAG: sensor histidine kinase, partial [Candidatus Kapaibacteriota bacterium]